MTRVHHDAQVPGDECVSGIAGIRCVAVIGLGLVGGSMTRDLAALGVRVLGADTDDRTVHSARTEGVVHSSLEESLDGIAEADVVVLAVPVDEAPRLLHDIAPRLRSAALVTDVGSTKRSIVAAAQAAGLGACFVGAHPLAGDHRSGWTASRPGLCRGARVYLCPTETASLAALELANTLWTALGGVTEVIDAATHDRLLGFTSHLPQATASALAHVLRDAGVAPHALGPGGHDVTRLAASSTAMWSAIARDNADHLDAALGALEQQLAALRDAVRRGDVDAVQLFFDTAREWRTSDV
jgi:prephenate dehydrogenase